MGEETVEMVDGYISRDLEEAGGTIRLFKRIPKLDSEDGTWHGAPTSHSNPNRIEPEVAFAVMTEAKFDEEYQCEDYLTTLPAFGDREPWSFEV